MHTYAFMHLDEREPASLALHITTIKGLAQKQHVTKYIIGNV